MEKALFSVIGRLTNAVEKLNKQNEQKKVIVAGIATSGASTKISEKAKKDSSSSILQEISLKLDTIISKMDEKTNISGNVSEVGKFIKTVFSGSSGLMLFLIYKAVKPILNRTFMDFLKILLFIDPKTNKPFLNKEQIKNITELSKILETTAKSLKTIVVSIALFALTLVAVALASPIILKGLGAFILTVTLFVMTMWAVKKFIENDKDNKKGTPLKSFMYISISLAVFALTFIAVAIAGPIIFKGLLVFVTVLTIFLLTLWIASKIIGSGKGGGLNIPFKKLAKGEVGGGSNEGIGKTILFITISVILLTLTFYFAAQFAGPILLGAAAVTGSLLILAPGLIAINIATSKLDWKKLLALLLFITGFVFLFGWVWNAVGLSGQEILLRSAAVMTSFILLGVGIGAIATAVSNVKWMDLFLSLVFVGAFIFIMGYLPKLLGISDPVQFGAMGAATAVAITALGGALFAYKKLAKDYGFKDALVLILTGVAIAVLGFGMKQIGEATTSLNGETLLYISAFLAGVVGTAIALGSSGVAFLGPAFIAAVGISLIVLGVGLKSIAEVPPFTEAQSEGLKLMLKGIMDAAFSVGLKGLLAVGVLTSIGVGLIPFSLGLMTLSKVDWSFLEKTKNFDIMGPVNNILNSLFGDNSPIKKASAAEFEKAMSAMDVISKAINAIQGLPIAIQNMANLRFFEYELDKKTGKLKLTGERQLTDNEIQRAGKNIAVILGQLLTEISNATSGKFFSSTLENFGKGVGAIMSNIGTLVDAVIKMATGTYSVYDTRKNPKTGLDEIYEKARLPITDAMYAKVGENIKKILTSILEPMAQMMDKDNGLIGKLFGGDMGKLQDIANVLNPVGTLLNSITDFASKLLSGENKKSNTELFAMMDTISALILNKYIPLISNFYTAISKLNISQGDKAKTIVDTFKSIADTIKTLSEVQTPFEKFVNTFDKFNKSLSTFGDIFKNKIGAQQLSTFTQLLTSINKAIEIGKIATDESLNKFGSASSKIVEDFSKIKTETNQSSTTAKNEIASEKYNQKENVNTQIEILNRIYESLQILTAEIKNNTNAVNQLKTFTIPVEVKKLPPNINFK